MRADETTKSRLPSCLQPPVRLPSMFQCPFRHGAPQRSNLQRPQRAPRPRRPSRPIPTRQEHSTLPHRRPAALSTPPVGEVSINVGQGEGGGQQDSQKVVRTVGTPENKSRSGTWRFESAEHIPGLSTSTFVDGEQLAAHPSRSTSLGGTKPLTDDNSNGSNTNKNISKSQGD